MPRSANPTSATAFIASMLSAGETLTPGAARRPEEPMQFLAHQPNTPCRPALATKLVTCGIAVSMSASYFSSTLSVSLTVS